ncbi:hypothetical protein BH20ACI1_BH20ACI1_13710 [soil metagenome]
MKECTKCRRCYDDSHVVCPNDDKPLMVSITCNVLISGRYLLEERLGKGGMGIVFKAKHKFLKSAHAIKVILPSLVEDDDALLIRFKQEAILAASIDHPNVIRVTDFGVEDENMPFLVMEYVDGSPLSSYLVKGQRLTPERAFELFQPIALGVAEAHSRGIIHRDLKPQNIMVVKGLPLKRAIKVLDFGLAKIKSTESFGSMIQAETMSNVIGSPPYMSPEQWENNKVDHRTDIYGLGVILYQMLTGNLPFQGDSVPSIMYQHLTAQMPSFASHDVSLSPRIEAVVTRALQKNSDDRTNSVEEMLAEFEEAIATVDVPLTVNVPAEQLKPYKPTSSPENIKSSSNINEETQPLSDSQKEKLYSYFDSSAKPNLLADEQLAQEFLQAQNRVEEAKGQVDESDKLVQELAEAQRIAQQAQQNALEAKQRIEADVRRRVESEMESKLAVEQQARQKAEAESLEREAAARKQAEERANHLAQAALEAQMIAEAERKKAENASRQRELEESVRLRAETAAEELAQQVADAKIRYQAAKQQAEYESELRIAAEEKRQQIESELQAVAEHETELRKLTEAEARKQIQEQASRFEIEALAAQERIEEARRLVELETRKREQAEAAKLRAEEEARRLADQISNFQKHIQGFQHLTDDGTSDSSNRNLSSENFQQPGMSVDNLSQRTLPAARTAFDQSHGTVEIQTRNSDENFKGFLNTDSIPKRNIALPVILASVFAALLVAAAGGYGLYKFVINKSQPPEPTVVKNTDEKPIEPLPKVKTKMVSIKGGDFMMGRNDVAWNDLDWGDQYPAHSVPVKPFNISKTEVSNEEYAEFMKETGYAAPGSWNKGKMPEDQEQMPVTFVSLTDAEAYTDWISKRDNKVCRLPTEEEWEFTARNGAQQTNFPWGNDWRVNLANIATGKVAKVGTSSEETLVGGMKDMLGNVIEWTSSKYALYPGNGGAADSSRQRYYVVRGSSWGENQNRLKDANLLLTRRQSIPADSKSPFLGFRIVCQP